VIVIVLTKRFEPELRNLAGRITDAKAAGVAVAFARAEVLVEGAQESDDPAPQEAKAATPKSAPQSDSEAVTPKRSQREHGHVPVDVQSSAVARAAAALAAQREQRDPDDEPYVIEPGALAQAAVALAEQQDRERAWWHPAEHLASYGARSPVDLILASWDSVLNAISASFNTAGFPPVVTKGDPYRSTLHTLLKHGIIRKTDFAAIESLRELRNEIVHGRTFSFDGTTGALAYYDLASQMVDLLRSRTESYLVNHVQLSAEQTPE
jgi:hypothetical protein